MSWLHSAEGYQVLCNRDEKRTRKPAEKPRVQEREGVRFIAPVDGDHGGAWIATNEFGVTLALLNGNVSGAPAREGSRSRGLLVLECIAAPSIESVRDRVSRADLDTLAPFAMVALAPGQPALLFDWSGGLVVTPDAEHRMPLTSSSFDTDNVRARRSEEFRRITEGSGVTLQALLRFHASHGDSPSAYSTCMHRDDAHTVSFTWVGVSPSNVRFFYSPKAPCQGGVFA